MAYTCGMFEEAILSNISNSDDVRTRLLDRNSGVLISGTFSDASRFTKHWAKEINQTLNVKYYGESLFHDEDLWFVNLYSNN